MNKRSKRNKWHFLAVIAVICAVYAIAVVNTVSIDQVEITIDSMGNKTVFLGNLAAKPITVSNGRWIQTKTWVEKDGAETEYYALLYDLQGNIVSDQTQEITIQIPYDKKIDLYFKTGPEFGSVKVSCGGELQIVDCYQEESGELHCLTINPEMVSGPVHFWGKAVLAIASFVFALLCCGIVTALLLTRKFQAFFRSPQFPSFAVAVVMFIFMAMHAGQQELRVNEMYQIGYLVDASSFSEAIGLLADLSVEMSPPFFLALTYFTYPLLPFGEFWVLLLPEVLTAFAVAVIGDAACQAAGKKVGFLASLIAATSTVIIAECGLEYRTYALYLLTSSLVFDFYIRRLKVSGQETRASLIKLGIAFCLMAYSHYYGVVICLALFCVDVIFFATKKISWKCIFSYVGAGLTFLVWFCVIINQFAYRMGGDSGWWMDAPDSVSLTRLLYFFAGTSESGKIDVTYIPVMILLLGIMEGLYVFFGLANEKDQVRIPLAKQVLGISSVVIVLVVVAMYTFANVAPLTIFINRYFIGLMPFVCFAFSLTLYNVINVATQRRFARSGVLYATCAVILFVNTNYYVSTKMDGVHDNTSPYKAAAQTLRGKNNPWEELFYRETTCIVSNNPNHPTLGWKEFYLTERGTLDIPDITTIYYTQEYEEILQYSDLFVLIDEYTLSDDFKQFLSENYNQTKVSTEITYCSRKQ